MAVGQKRRPTGPNWHRRAVGEPKHWRAVGERQRDFLIEHGLKAHHTVLDLGCGGLRAGVRLIPYLDTGNYYGLDNEQRLLNAAWKAEVEGQLEDKRPTLLCNGDFDLAGVPDLDYVLAQSLFTHLRPGAIRRCVRAVLSKLKPAGFFFATMNVSPDGGVHTGEQHNWRDERDVTRYPFALIREIVESEGGEVEYIGRWGHPKYEEKTFLQRMVVIRHRRQIEKVRPLRDAVTTLVLYHPLRPLRCLNRALRSLNAATRLPHRVEVVVQGKTRKALPSPAAFPHLDLHYFAYKRNAGTGPRLRAAIRRFLASDARWFAKCDDDMSLPEGAWDTLIGMYAEEAWQGKYAVGAAMLAVPKSMWAGVPRNLGTVKRPGKLPKQRWRIGGRAKRKVQGLGTWHVCDFADHGSTVFARAPFEAGALPDPIYFQGGNDWDLCYQLLDRGFKSILCIEPRAGHHHKDCKPPAYKAIRYRPETTNLSGEHFMEKWGIEIEMLTTFGGFDKCRWSGKDQRFYRR